MFQCYALSLVAFRYGGREMNHRASLQGFGRPMSQQEARQKAMELCLETYPSSDGWFNHQVGLAGFDPQAIADKFTATAL